MKALQAEVQIPEDLKLQLDRENSNLDRYIKLVGRNYYGTDPLADAQTIYTKRMKTNLNDGKQNDDPFPGHVHRYRYRHGQAWYDPFDIFGHWSIN